MNNVYKSVWNEALGAWVAVSENSPARGKRNGRLAKAAVASAVTFGAVSGASAAVSLDGGTVVTSPSGVNNGIAIGSGSSANADYGIATGAGASAKGVNDIAIGADAKVDSKALFGDGGALGSVAVGSNAKALATSAASFGALANASGFQSTALGSHATASATASTAIGMSAVADRDNTVSIGNSTTQRQLVQVARGTKTTDAVNVSQLTPVVDALGGAAKLNADGTVTAPAYKVGATSYNNVGDAITALGKGNKYLSANDAAGSSAGASAIGLGSISIGGNSIADGTGGLDAALAIGSDTRAGTKATAVGPGATASAFNSVSLGTLSVADRAGTVSVGNATNKRQIVNVAAGTQATDVVNVAQLTPVVTALGGKASLNADGSITAPSYNVGTATFTNVGDALSALDNGPSKYFHTNSTLADSTAAGVESIAVGGAANSVNPGDIAIGMNSSATGKDLPVIDGSVSATAIGSHATASGYSAVALGGRSIATGEDNTAIGADSHATGSGVVGGSSAGGATAVGAGAAATNHFTTAIGRNSTATALNSVALGASSVADRDNTVSVGSATQLRQIANVGAGTLANDAVNVTQLQNVTTLLGGGAKVNDDGSIKAPVYTVASTTLGTVGDAIAKIDTELGNKVAYDKADKSLVTLGGVGATKPTKLTNLSVADLSANSSDAVNGSQLYATNNRVLSVEAFKDNINNGGGIKYFHTNSSQADSAATGAESVAIGGGAKASANNAIALGANSIADRKDSVSVGAAGGERQITNVAAGAQSTDAVNFGQLTSVAQDVNKLGTFALKYDTGTDGKPNYERVTLGGAGAGAPTKLTNLSVADLSANSSDAVNGSQLYATNNRVLSVEAFKDNINNGGGIKYFHTNSTLADSSAVGTNSVAIGGAANTSANNAVALGSSSVADRDNTVSVGAAGKERQITNVAAGSQGTDAVNFTQLTAVSNNVDTLGSFAVKYDTGTDGKPNYQSVTLGGAGASQPTKLTKLTNLKIGDLSSNSTDAINGSQLYSTNQRVGSLETFEGNINNGGGIKYFHTNSTLGDSSATGTDSVAIGGAALSSGQNSVALGSNSVADRDNAVSVGAVGSERQVTNVAAGTASTDAANVGQLNALSSSVTSLSASAIKYDTNADGTPDYANATLGNGNATGTTLHNVAAGTNAMDAVNLSQVNSLIGQVTNIANNAYNPLFTADGDRNTEVASSSGTHSVASGANAVASGVNAVASGAASMASGANSVAFGSNTSATANNAVAVGAKASATASNAVALGAGSVADRANSVSVGTTAAGGQRQVTNVAAGTEGTDAVNVNQMQQSVNTGVKSAKGYTDALRSDMNSGLSLANNHINSVGAMSSAMAMMAGSAAAIADKDNRFAAGTGVYRDKAAIAIGFQKRFGTNMVLTVGGSTTGEETTGGAGFAFGF